MKARIPNRFARYAALVALAFAPGLHPAADDDAATPKQLISRREVRPAEMIEDLKRLSDQVEGRVDQTVDLLASVTDSDESASQVHRVKSSAIELLKKEILFNDRRKRDLAI